MAVDLLLAELPAVVGFVHALHAEPLRLAIAFHARGVGSFVAAMRAMGRFVVGVPSRTFITRMRASDVVAKS